MLFLSLMAQLAIPLNWFGTFYRTVMHQMLDADGLFSLLAQVPTVVDAVSFWVFVFFCFFLFYKGVVLFESRERERMKKEVRKKTKKLKKK